MKGCIGRGNIAVGPRLMGLVPSREVEANERRMSGTTRHVIVPVYSTRLVLWSLVDRQAHRAP